MSYIVKTKDDDNVVVVYSNKKQLMQGISMSIKETKNLEKLTLIIEPRK
jgi:hypothetical protein